MTHLLFNHLCGQYFKTQGGSIYYEDLDRTSTEKPVLVVLHGGGQDMSMFNFLTPDLSEKFRIIGIDTRGHGKSSLGITPLTYAQIQQDVESLLENIGIKEVFLCGFSDGGVVSYRIAATQKIHVKKLVTIGASWHIEDLLAVKSIIDSINSDVWKSKFPEMYQKYKELNPDQDFDRFISAMLSMWMDLSEQGHPNQSVSNITCPTLLVRGDQDIFISRESISKLAALISGAHILNIPFAGHAVYEQQKEILLHSLKQFLQYN